MHSLRGQICVPEMFIIIWERWQQSGKTNKQTETKKHTHTQNKAHDKAEKHLLWYLGNDRNTLPHDNIKDELDISF